MRAAGQELIDEGKAALRAGDASSARRVFERVFTESPSAAALDGLAQTAYLELDFPRAIEDWEKAYRAYRDAGDPVGAVRVARLLSFMYGSTGNPAVMSGWISRAQTLLGDGAESAEVGWVALSRGMFEGDRATKNEHFRQAIDVARRFGDANLEFVSLAYLGASLVHDDCVEEGMTLLDEALAAVAGGDVDDFSNLQDIFCQLFSACEYAHDVTRADQWIRVGDAIARRRSLPAVSAFCRTHYGGLLTAAGRWPEADAALTEAVRLWGLGHRSLRGGALIRLADLRVRQGRFEEAQQLLTGLEGDVEAARPLAAIHLAKGEAAVAHGVIERALHQLEPASSIAAPLLGLLVDVHLAAGDVDRAQQAVEQLAACVVGHPSSYLEAMVALARGRLCLATGTGDPCACLHDALAGFARAEMPMELARSRLDLAAALTAERPEVAMAEARAALEAFERLHAARDADAAGAVLRSLGARTAPGRKGSSRLTDREAEVLDLLGYGLSNPEISDRLFISRKTVEHHVGNILAKLGLRSRSEVAAYAARQKPGPE